MDIIELGALDDTPVSQTDDVLFELDGIQEDVVINNVTDDNAGSNTATVENNFAVVNTYEGSGEPDTYQFEIAQAGTYQLELSNLEANLDLAIGDNQGNTIYSSTALGTESELIDAELASGNYIAYISGEANITSDYSFTISQTSTEGESNGGNSEDNTEGNDDAPLLNQGDTVYRFLKTEVETQFYTTSEVERDVVIETLPNYTYEGESFIGAPEPETNDITGIVPVYRFFNTNTGVHLYTTSEIEKNYVTENLPHYNSEGIAYYGYETQVDNSVPLYRFYHQNLDAHFYTSSVTERDEFLADAAYTLEGETGIAYYVNPVGDL